MRRSIGVLAVLAVIVGTATVVGQSKPDRRIGHDARYPIASQLRPDERHVIVEFNGTPPLVILRDPPKGESRLEWLAKQWDVILVATVERIDPVLIFRDREFREAEVPAEHASWIVSTVQARVEDVIKGAGEFGRTVGDRVSLKVEGGTAMIRGTLVEAVVPWEPAMVQGRKYLLFGRMYNGEFVKNHGYAESSTAWLTRMTRPIPGSLDALGRPAEIADIDDAEQWTLDQAVGLLREALR